MKCLHYRKFWISFFIHWGYIRLLNDRLSNMLHSNACSLTSLEETFFKPKQTWIIFIIIFINFFQYVRERDLNYFHFWKISKIYVLLHLPVAKDCSLISMQLQIILKIRKKCRILESVLKYWIASIFYLYTYKKLIPCIWASIV